MSKYTDKMVLRALFDAQVEPSSAFVGNFANTGQIIKKIASQTGTPESEVQYALNKTGIIQTRLHSLVERGYVERAKVGHSYVWRVVAQNYNSLA